MMPRNVQHVKNDHHLEVPSMFELSAEVVANNAETLFGYFVKHFPAQAPTSQQPQQQPSSSSIVDNGHARIANLRDPLHPQSSSCDHQQGLLPLHASDKILQKLCGKWSNMQQQQASADMLSPKLVAASLKPFYNGQLCPVTTVNISSVRLTDGMLVALLVGQRETLTSLSLINSTKGICAALICTILHEQKIKLMNLRSLKLDSLDILRDRRSHYPPQFLHFSPNLEHLYLLQGHTYNTEKDGESKSEFLVRIFSELPKLKTLDLSGWILDNLSPLQKLQSLTTLVLYDVPDLEPSIFTIATLTTLRHLDISQSDRSHGQYVQPVSSLHQLAWALKGLKSLDISGTNLTVAPSENDCPFNKGTGTIVSDIPGLSYLECPLIYLGIFNCEGTSVEWKNISAEKISGNYGEDQVLTALEVYLERPRTLQAVLYESDQLYEDGWDLKLNFRHDDALFLVSRALEMHLDNKDMQIVGITSMITIIDNMKTKMNWITKRRVIQALIDGMEKHLDSPDIVLVCCSGFHLIDIPKDVLFAYDRVSNLLISALKTHYSDEFIQRRMSRLLAVMVYRIEHKLKIRMAESGVIETILQQISRTLRANNSDISDGDDDMMKWSFLCNITDEVPANCERFLKANGLALFNECYNRFADQNSVLMLSMIGVLFNIAEVCQLRDHLMTIEFLEIFCNLDDGILISYASAGVLAQLTSDECWTRSGTILMSRDNVNDLIIQAIGEWDLQTDMDLNYASLKPVLRLLTHEWHDTFGAWHWAVWTLANLTTAAATADKKQKYCRLITEEGGIHLLEQLLTESNSTEDIRQLARIVIKSVEDWNNNLKKADLIQL